MSTESRAARLEIGRKFKDDPDGYLKAIQEYDRQRMQESDDWNRERAAAQKHDPLAKLHAMSPESQAKIMGVVARKLHLERLQRMAKLMDPASKQNILLD